MDAPRTEPWGWLRGEPMEDLTPDLLRLGAALVTFVAAIVLGLVR